MSTTGKNFSGPIVIDPVTRVEGHVKVRVEVNGGVVTDAFSSVSLYRGLEQILKGRRPEDAHHFTQRACGVCTNTHALTTLRAVEDALELKIPENARLVRLLLLSTTMLHDHIVHFYHLHSPDWVDFAAALKADPASAAKKANAGAHRGVDPEFLGTVKARVKRFVEDGQLGFIANADFLGGHAAYKLSPEMNLVMAANYFKALEVQRRLGQAMAMVGSKSPHSQTMIVGGVTCYDFISPERLAAFAAIWAEAKAFVMDAYIPDLIALGQAYPEWSKVGGNPNYFAVPDFRLSMESDDHYFLGGVVMNQDVKNVEALDQTRIAEHVAHSWYEGAEARHPYQGETKPRFTSMDDPEKYSWTKAPRYMGQPMEMGPLGRVVVHHALGNNDLARMTDVWLKATGLGPKALFSTMGRTAARGLETAVLAQRTDGWIEELRSRVDAGDDQLCVNWKMKDEAKGVGWTCVPRGELSHWIQIKGGVIDNFQLVVPSTWNCGPRCAQGLRGPMENSLMHTPIVDAARPVELLRTIHSYDPCLACSVHLVDGRSQRELTVKAI